MGPEGPVGRLTRALGVEPLPFTFWGLVVGSVVYSLPFMVQPMQDAFEAMGDRPLEVAATLGSLSLRRFRHSGLALGEAWSAHRGGVDLRPHRRRVRRGADDRRKRPGITRTASVEIYDYVEAGEYGQAHRLALVMLVFSFLVLLAVRAWRPRLRRV